MRYLLSIAMLATAWTAGAQGTTAAIQAYAANGVVGLFDSQTAGWTFQVAAPITITELGCLADFFPHNPAATQIRVGLWASDGSRLASTSITPGSTLRDQTRYEAVAPLSLTPGQTYQIGAYWAEGLFSLDAAFPLYGGTVTPATTILLLGSALGDGGYTAPLTEAGGDGGAYLGPNFLFQSQPKLAIRLATANQLRLSWPTAYTGYTLQAKLGLFGTWVNAVTPATLPAIIGNEYVVFDILGSVLKFYRLAGS